MKKTVLRTCAVTGTKLPKEALFRVVKANFGLIVIDPTQTAPGRGAYLSKDKDIILEAKRRNSLTRVLRAYVDPSIYDQLLALLEDK